MRKVRWIQFDICNTIFHFLNRKPGLVPKCHVHSIVSFKKISTNDLVSGVNNSQPDQFSCLQLLFKSTIFPALEQI